MKVIIAGGSGFLGRQIATRLIAAGHSVTIIARKNAAVQGAAQARWSDDLGAVVDGADVVINLTGANVGGRRWTPAYRRELVQSRLQTTRQLVDAILKAKRPPALVSMSGTGYYGNSMTPSNEGLGAGATFLATLCDAWETEARRAESVTRVVLLRLAPVLDPSEGMLAKLVLPMRLFVGAVLGSGRQWVPWIHRDDAVGVIIWAASNKQAAGAYNVSAPEQVTMRDLTTQLAQVLHRPVLGRVPGGLLRLALGSMADMILHSQRIAPWRLEGEGYTFRFPTLKGALQDLLSR
ncbi:MAG: TIGR01777 family protein [Candidatus Kapabacteria bacterium]|nr:TIGR01777 family protein [Candidatus Kapabacteria bacterium]